MRRSSRTRTSTRTSTGCASASWPLILVAAIVANVTVNLRFPEYAGLLPVHRRRRLGRDPDVSCPSRRPDWEVLPETIKGAVFLLSLVGCASMMPVEKLPAASWQTALGLGFVSAVFDNIPLTALALKQGGYDWGFLAYAVGFGGSMIWFGSSAGVALSNMYPEARSVRLWLRHGWLGGDCLRHRLRRDAVRTRLATATQGQAAAASRDRGRPGRTGDSAGDRECRFDVGVPHAPARGNRPRIKWSAVRPTAPAATTRP